MDGSTFLQHIFPKKAILLIKRSTQPVIILLCLLAGLSILTNLIQSRWGLTGRYYTNTQWQGNPAQSKRDLAPFLKGPDGYNLLAVHEYSVKWDGWIAIPETGIYRFATYSDDGSSLWLDGKKIIDNGGMHGLQRVSQEITLQKGIYPIKILYLQVGGFSFMQALWTPPGQSESPLPSEILFVKPPGQVAIVFRKGVLILSQAVSALWQGVLIGAGLLMLFPIGRWLLAIVQSWNDRTHFLHTFSQFLTRNRPPLMLTAGCFLSLLVVLYASSNHRIPPSHQKIRTVTANYNSRNISLAFDGRTDTHWSSNHPQVPGMEFQIAFEQSVKIGKIEIVHGNSQDHAPRGLRVEISDDTLHWTRVQVLDFQGTPSSSTIIITPFKIQHLKITQTGHGSEAWMIDECAFFSPAFIPLHFRYLLLILIICGLVGSGCSLLISCLPNVRRCGQIVVIMLSLAIALGLFFRIFMLSYHDFDVDEQSYLSNARLDIVSDITWVKKAFNTDVTRSPIFHLLFIRWFFNISQNLTLSVRLMSAILGTLSIPLVFLIWHHISSRKEACFEALLAAAMLAPLVYHVCWSRDGHGEISMTFFYMLYIFIAYKSLKGEYSVIRGTFLSGLILFIGFYFHGTMLITPFGIIVFSALDALFKRVRIPLWPGFTLKRYFPLFLSMVLFFSYVFYILITRNAMADIPTDSGAVSSNTGILPPLLNFIQVRWQTFIENLRESWWIQYGIPQSVGNILKVLAIAGAIDIIIRRKKQEWFLIVQPVFFSLIIAFLITSGSFERHFHPFVLTLTCLVARGTNVMGMCFRGPRSSAYARFAIGVMLISSLSVISGYNIFMKLPGDPSLKAYYFYGGQTWSSSHFMKTVKRSERGANNIVCTVPWLASYYSNTFTLNIRHIDRYQLTERILSHQMLPIFVIVADRDHNDEDFIEVLEKTYARLGTSYTGNSWYELRENAPRHH